MWDVLRPYGTCRRGLGELQASPAFAAHFVQHCGTESSATQQLHLSFKVGPFRDWLRWTPSSGLWFNTQGPPASLPLSPVCAEGCIQLLLFLGPGNNISLSLRFLLGLPACFLGVPLHLLCVGGPGAKLSESCLDGIGSRQEPLISACS